MTPKQWYKRAAAMLTAFALMFVLIPFAGGTNVKAASEQAVSLSDVKLLVNGRQVTDDTKLNNDDKVEFSFNWEVNKGNDESLVNPLVADIDFQGIYLLATEGHLQQDSMNRGTYTITRTAEGNKILFYVEEDQLKESRISGTASFTGNISYTSDDVGNDGRFDIKATVKGSPIFPPIRPQGNKEEEQEKKGARVDKNPKGTIYKGTDGNYYQDYTVTVVANWDNTEAYSIDKIVDTPADATKTSFTGDITATSNGSVTGLKENYSSFNDIKGISLGAGAEVEFTYTMKVNSALVKDQSTKWEYRNIVKVNDLMEKEAHPWNGISSAFSPNVSKTSTVNETTHRITWTVTISHINFTGDTETDKKLVTDIKDTLEADPATGEFPTVVGNKLTAEEFWSKVTPKKINITDDNKRNYSVWSYTYTYTAEYEDNNAAVDRNFRNVFSATIDGYQVSDGDTATVPGKGVPPVDKQFTRVNDDGTIDWTITLQTPATGSVEGLKFYDTATADEELSHEIVGNITVRDETGATIGSPSVTNDPANPTQKIININGTIAGGKTLTVTLKTRITDSGLREGKYYNRVYAKYTHVLANGKKIPVTTNEDGDQYTATNAVTKSEFTEYDKFNAIKVDRAKNRVGWFVNVDLSQISGITPNVGDTIRIRDNAELVEFDWDPNKPDVTVDSSIGIEQIYAIHTSGKNNMYYSSPEKIFTTQYLNNSTVKLVDSHTIEITVTPEMIRDGNIGIYYTQIIPNTELLNGMYRINNSATVTYNGRGIGIEDAHSTPTVFSKEDLLKKSNSTEGSIIHYTVEVNKPELNLSGNEDDIVILEDVMGSLLRLKEDSITVVDGRGTPLASGLWSYTFDKSTRKLTITLPDRTYCLVKYDAFADIKKEYVEDAQGQTIATVYKVNGQEVSLDEIKNSDSVTNTASLAGSGGFSESTSDVWAVADVDGGVTIKSTLGSLVVNKYDSLDKSLRLNGAEFSLVSGRFLDGKFKPYTNELAHANFETIYYNTGNTSDMLFEDLELDIIYELKEITPPEDYKVFEGARYITIRAPGDPEPVIENIPAGITVECYVAGETINIANEPGDGNETTVETEVNISKREIGGSAELPGARIRIAKVSGNTDMSKDSITVSGGAQNVTKSSTAIEFTSGSSPAVIKGLPAGEYRMVEDAAPAGYKKATAISFRININTKNGTYTVTRDGKTLANKTVVMEDEITEMSISKQNVFANEVPGARLTLTGTDASGRTINFAAQSSIRSDNATLTKGSRSLAFTSGSEATVIYGLGEGTYVLHEESAPSGYILAQDIPFAIDKSGVIRLYEDDGSLGGVPVGNKLIMTDDRTSVLVKKSDFTGLPQIPGATIQITPRDNNVDLSKVDVYNSSNLVKSRGRVTFKTTTYVAEIRGLPAGEYIFSETIAPEGYELVQSNFIITINEDGTAVPRYNDDDYNYENDDSKVEYDYILHKITMKDKPKNIVPEIPEKDITLGLSGLPITKMDMAGSGTTQLTGAELKIIPVGNGASVADATAECADGLGGKRDIGNNDGTTLTFITPGETVYVFGLTVGTYRLIETSAPGGYEVKDEFNFEVIIVNNTYRVVAGEDNGYNILTDNGVIIRNYRKGEYPDPEPENTETEPKKTSMSTTVPETEPTDDESSGGGEGDQTSVPTSSTSPTGTNPGTTYPAGPSGGHGPSGGIPVITGGQSPGFFLDPSITNHTERTKTEPLESEDIKAGVYVVGQDNGSDAKDAAIGMAVVAVMASAVYALSKALRRRRSK